MASVFFSYSHADEALRDQLETQLALLKRQGVVAVCMIGGSARVRNLLKNRPAYRDRQHHTPLGQRGLSGLGLLLRQGDDEAMERHEFGEAIVIPVILRACDCTGLLSVNSCDAARRKTGHAVSGSGPSVPRSCQSRAQCCRPAQSKSASSRSSSTPAAPVQTSLRAAPGPRSSNLRVAKQFSDRDKDAFRIESFEFMRSFSRSR